MGILGDLQDLYKEATEAVKVNARGFTPFQFSSRMTQVNTSQLGRLLPEPGRRRDNTQPDLL